MGLVSLNYQEKKLFVFLLSIPKTSWIPTFWKKTWTTIKEATRWIEDKAETGYLLA